MKVKLDFNNMPLLYRSLDKKREIEFEFMGCTLRDLTERLVKRFGTTMKDALLDSRGEIDMEIRVLLNDTEYLTDRRMEAKLDDGDMLAFIMGG